MRFEKTTIKSSPYLGIFALVTNKLALVPQSIIEKEFRILNDVLNVELIKCSLGDSSLIGVLSSAIQDKVLLSELVTKKEIDFLNNIGIKTKIMPGISALGNLMRVTEKGGIVSKIFSSNQIKEMESFLGIKLFQQNIAESDLVGANCCASTKGFIVNSDITEADFLKLKKIFQTNGKPSTANYGDKFVGNCVIANEYGVAVGLNTTAFELMRIDEGLRGED